MRRAVTVVVLLVCAALLSPALPASGDPERAPRSVASRVVVQRDNLDQGALEYTIWGRVASPVKGCVKRRGIKLTAVENGSRIRSFRATRTGAWRVVLRPADVEGLTAAVFKVSGARKVVRSHGRRVACKPASMLSVHTEVEFDNFTATAPPNVVANGHLEVDIVGRCRGGRIVTLRNTTTGTDLGSDVTDGAGAWAVPFDAVATGSETTHTYRASTGRKVVRWNGLPATCLAGSTAVVADDVPIITPRSRGMFGSR